MVKPYCFLGKRFIAADWKLSLNEINTATAISVYKVIQSSAKLLAASPRTRSREWAEGWDKKVEAVQNTEQSLSSPWDQTKQFFNAFGSDWYNLSMSGLALLIFLSLSPFWAERPARAPDNGFIWKFLSGCRRGRHTKRTAAAAASYLLPPLRRGSLQTRRQWNRC